MSGTICIVDDEPSILNALNSILEDEGYKVTIAKTGQEALNIIQQEPPDLVILDLWIGDCDSLEVFERVREQFPKMPVIMTFGQGSTETVVKLMKLGTHYCLEKPLDLERVITVVRDSIRESTTSE